MQIKLYLLFLRLSKASGMRFDLYGALPHIIRFLTHFVLFLVPIYIGNGNNSKSFSHSRRHRLDRGYM